MRFIKGGSLKVSVEVEELIKILVRIYCLYEGRASAIYLLSTCSKPGWNSLVIPCTRAITQRIKGKIKLSSADGTVLAVERQNVLIIFE